MAIPMNGKPAVRIEKGLVHCLICTRSVEAEVIVGPRQARVRPGQKCPRCASSLDPAYVVRMDRAA